MKTRRIFYFSKHHGAASGGARTSYRHVEVLCRHGFDASILLLPSKAPADFESTVPVLPFESRMSFAMTDILVIPEGWAWLMRPFGASQLRTVVFCQNAFYMFDGLGAMSLSLLKFVGQASLVDDAMLPS